MDFAIGEKSTLAKGAILGAIIVIAIVIGALALRSGMPSDKIDNGDTVILKISMFYQNGSTAAPRYEETIRIGDAQISPAFDNNIVGLKKGSKKEFTLEAADAFGNVDLSLFRQYPKFKTFDRVMTVPNIDIRSGLPPSKDIISEGEKIKVMQWPWPILILDIDSENITFAHEPVLNSLYIDPLILVWPIKITKLTNDEVTMEFLPKIGSVADDEDLGRGQVVDFDSEKVIVDYNHELAGQAILFKVEILEVQKD